MSCCDGGNVYQTEMFPPLRVMILKIINEQKSPPTKAQLIAIRNVLLQFEDEHRKEVNTAGKLLIKQRYIKERVDYDTL